MLKTSKGSTKTYFIGQDILYIRIGSLENELKLKEQSVASIQGWYIYKVKKNLIDSNPNKCLGVSKDGLIENWFLLNKDAKK